MQEARFNWMKLVGAMITLALLLSLGFIAIRGWCWYKDFLVGAAPAWIQAFGSIGAIIVGFVYTDRANQHQRERDAKAESDLKRKQLLAVLAACTQAEEVEAWMYMAIQFGEKADIGSLQLATDEAQVAFKSIPFLDVPDEELLQSTGVLRKNLVSMQIRCRAITNNPKVMNDGYLEVFLTSFARNLASVRERASVLLANLPRNPA